LESLNYVWAWCFYLLSAVGLIIVFWRMTRNMTWRRTRRALRSLAAVLLLTPISVVDQGSWLAPAFLAGGYDWILGDTESAARAGMYLLSAYALLVAVILLESVLRRILGLGRA